MITRILSGKGIVSLGNDGESSFTHEKVFLRMVHTSRY